MADKIVVAFPHGPIRPIVEALDENEILFGWIAQLEHSAAHQLQHLRTVGGDRVEDGDHLRETYHGLDGDTWALDHLFAEYFPGIQRAAAFLAIWGVFERHIDELCREVALAGSFRVKLNDLAGRGLVRSRLFLLRVAGLEGDWAHAHWSEIQSLRQVRNIFAHGDGHIAVHQQAQRTYVERSSHMSLNDDGVVQLAASFLTHLLTQQRQFLRALETVVVLRFGTGAAAQRRSLTSPAR